MLPKHKTVLQPLLDIVPLDSSSSDGGSSTGLDPLLPGGPTILLSPATGQQHSYQQLLPFLKKLERGQAQESKSNYTSNNVLLMADRLTDPPSHAVCVCV